MVRSVDMDATTQRGHVFGSIESSLRALQADSIDLLYIHNATEKMLRETAIRDSLEEARSQGKIRLAGATCYGEEDALAVLKDPLFQVLQVPFSLLNQEMRRRVFPEAAPQGSGRLCAVRVPAGRTHPSDRFPAREAGSASRAYFEDPPGPGLRR